MTVPAIRHLQLLALGAVAAAVAMAGPVPAAAAPPPASAGNVFHGFLAQDGEVTPIDHPEAPVLPDAGTSTVGINDHGEILGIYGDQVSGACIFVRDRKGRFTTIADPVPGVVDTQVVDINNRGWIVGFTYQTTADLEQGISHGYLRLRNGRVRVIDVPGAELTRPFRANDRGQIAGHYLDGQSLRGFVWERGKVTTIDVPGAVHTLLYGINNREQMVGTWIDADGAYHGFLRKRNGAIRTFDAPGAALTQGGTGPTGINERGQVVGSAFDEQGGSRGFLYHRGRFTPIDAPGAATYTRPLDISNRGQIVGDYDTEPPAASDDPARPRAPVPDGLRRAMEGEPIWLP